ncbi:MAG: M13 family metallopeptidase [Acidobacteria bacterium]|nr:M13 family metallopeptidase [Acidobacteriota bacterium]
MRTNHLKLALALLLLLQVGLPAAAAQDAQSHGLDLAAMDTSVRPGEDFFRYANGKWLDSTPIPPDRSSVGVFQILDEEANRRTNDLIRNAASQRAPAGSELRKIADFYQAYMDERGIERKGLTPINPELARIRAIRNKTALARVLGSQLRADVDALNNTNFYTDRILGLWVSPDFNRPERNVGYLLQGGLGMPDRDNYLNTDADSTRLQGKYRAHIASVLNLAGVADSAGKAARIYDLEHKIAEAHVSRTDSVDVNKANNPWRLREFPTRAPGLDWASFFAAAGLSAQPMIMVWHPSGVTGIAALAGSQPLDVWKDYLVFHAVDRASGLLPKRFADERFSFYGTALSGTTQQRAREKRAVNATSDALGDAVGKLYVKNYFPPSAKATAQEMVRNIIAAFGRRIDRLDWMTPATREKAKAKLSTLYVGIGYPDKWRSYAGLVVRRDDPLGNRERSELFDYRAALAKLGKPVDKHEWWMTPQTVNALNLPLQNALNFPAAILNPPFFDAAADDALNYGAIGAVIGHEISHSFDDQGSQFDARGRLLNWWTPEDMAHFRASADRLAAQYDAYEPLPNMHVNGKLTLSENIADVAGLSASYDGYHAAHPDAQSSQGFAPDQRFFLAYAQAWRGKSRPEALRGQLMTDGHAPDEYRADTVRNIDAWYQAFDVQPGQKLYLAPPDRVRVW